MDIVKAAVSDLETWKFGMHLTVFASAIWVFRYVDAPLRCPRAELFLETSTGQNVVIYSLRHRISTTHAKIMNDGRANVFIESTENCLSCKSALHNCKLSHLTS